MNIKIKNKQIEEVENLLRENNIEYTVFESSFEQAVIDEFDYLIHVLLSDKEENYDFVEMIEDMSDKEFDILRDTTMNYMYSQDTEFTNMVFSSLQNAFKDLPKLFKEVE